MEKKIDSKVIFDTLLTAVQIWGFGLDGATTMVGKNVSIATLLKKLNPFLTSTHCIAHRTNLAALEASKNESCKAISSEVDSMLNTLVGHFKNSYKCKVAL
jgi:hypothetical protein